MSELRPRLGPDLVVRDAEIDGHRVDVTMAAGLVVDVCRAGWASAATHRVDARGGALLPGLHDHHIHLLALAAARQSLVFDADFVALARLEHIVSPPGRWLRVVGYHESILGEIDRAWLDDVLADRPIRVQHRSGAMWVLNSAALHAAGIDSPDGRLIGGDDLVRSRVPGGDVDLAPIGDELRRYGFTGVTDLTPYETLTDALHLASAVRRSGMPLRVMVTGGPALAGHEDLGLPRGPVKIVVADHDLPDLDSLVADFRTARRSGRNVAVHCVTRIGLVLALAAWEDVGVLPGDRIEHGAVVPVSLIPTIRDLGLTVVTQPSFVCERGDGYLLDVDIDEQQDLWRCGSLLRADVAVAGSTDAPFGSADPWQAIATAVHRTTTTGQSLGATEGIDARRALDLFLGSAFDPGGPPRAIAVGEIADLCLLRTPLAQALREPSAVNVAGVVIGGRWHPNG